MSDSEPWLMSIPRHQVRTQVESIIEKQGGRARQVMPVASGDDHHMDALLKNRGFV
jgi:hypothetical protein